jgi:glycosyltransferase involved in cell wall biosynthesis
MIEDGDRQSNATLLLIAYDFPPHGGGGVQRPAKLCKYLTENGWRIFVLTASRCEGIIDPLLDPGKVSIKRAQAPTFSYSGAFASNIRKKAVAFKHRVIGIASHIFRLQPKRTSDGELIGDASLGLLNIKLGWLPKASIEGYKLLRKSDVDIICATLPPATTAFVGLLLHFLFHKPLVIDYRDPWTLYPDWLFDENGQERKDLWTRMRLWVERRLENFILGKASGISFAGGPHLVDDFVTCFPSINKDKYYHVPNGFDSQDWQLIHSRNLGQREPFHLAFLGNFYGLHTPHFFLLGLRKFLDKTGIEANAFQVSFTGLFPDSSRNLVSKLHLSPYVKIASEVSYTSCLEKMLQANALLVTLPPLRPSRHWVPGKLYEYLVTSKPILAVVPEGAASDLVRASGRGLVVNPEDSEAIAEALERLVSGDCSIFRGSERNDFLVHFERRNLAKRFECLFDACLIQFNR